MTLIEAAKMAREAMKEWTWLDTPPPNVKDALAALNQAIAKAEQQEPVAWMGAHDHTDLYYRKPPQADVIPLYKSPPKREWQGLTDNEVHDCYEEVMFNPDIEPTRVRIYEAIEAKLKEKNT